MKLNGFAMVVALGILVAAPVEAALKSPRVGTAMTWSCTGPFGKQYVVRVASVSKGIVRYQGRVDGAKYWADKPASLTGTSLWLRKSGGRAQEVELNDFRGLERLRPGSRFKGAVPAREGEAKWVWSYRIAVGEPKSVRNKVLGQVMLYPVQEHRKVYHGDYSSRMTSLVEANLGITVEWIYQDSKGTEHCVLADLNLPAS